MTLTATLTDSGLAVREEDITPAAYDAAGKVLLDSLGCALAAQSAPGVANVFEQMRAWGGAPEASVLCHGDKLPAPNAVFANSTMVHALDYDDVHIPGTLHITSIVVPAMLAAAEMSGASGRAALAAMVMGIEVAGRLAIAERPRRRGQGFLPSSTAGGFGGVIAAGRLLGLTHEQCVNAMGMNYAQASGNRQALFDATLTKRIQPAFAARSALWSVALARQRMTGAERAIEGDAGYFRTYMNGDVPDVSELMVERPCYEVERVALKRYPSCGACHSVQAATEKLVAEETIDAARIAKVEIFGHGEGNGFVSRPLCIDEHPQVAVQFNVAWAVAHTLLRGPAGLADYTDDAIRNDPEVLALADAVAYVPHPANLPPPPERPADYPEGSVRYQGVIVTLKGGQRIMRAQAPCQTFAPGTPPLEEVITKFRNCAAFSGVCTDAKAQEIIERVQDLNGRETCSPLRSAITT
jgi:2-methylcitrate dehydratase PrpD